MDQEFVRIGKYLVSIRVLLAILPVGGVIIGFLLSWIKDWIQEGSQAKRYKSLLKFEMDHNLSLLQEIWGELEKKRNLFEQVTFANTETESPEEKNSINRQIGNGLALHLASIASPNWRRNVWESQVGLLARALTADEIRRIHRFYSNLDKISDIRLKIRATENEHRETPQASSAVEQFASSIQRMERQAKLWQEGESLIRKILEERNPLEQ